MVPAWIPIQKNSSHVAREKIKARQWKQSPWWKNLIAKGQCHYCNKKFPPRELTMDHVVPLARGGKTTRGNVVVACQTCNAQKKYLTPVDLILDDLKNNSRKK